MKDGAVGVLEVVVAVWTAVRLLATQTNRTPGTVLGAAVVAAVLGPPAAAAAAAAFRPTIGFRRGEGGGSEGDWERC